MKNSRSSMRRAKRLLRVAAFGAGCLLSVVAIADERFTLSSPGLTDNATLDSRHAASAQDCGGKNISLPLAWSNAPTDTKSFAVTIYDPDGARGLGIVHWISTEFLPRRPRSEKAGRRRGVSAESTGQGKTAITDLVRRTAMHRITMSCKLTRWISPGNACRPRSIATR